jgi:3-oxoacyl-(acyl-carrier-protein) synthase
VIVRACAAAGSAPESLPPWVPVPQRRRLDLLQRVVCDAVGRLGVVPGALPSATGLVFSTAFGCLDTTQRFADTIARFGDAGASPTPFTTSVHNSPAGTLGELLGLHGPCATLSADGCGTLAALRLAWAWIAAGRCAEVLVVVGDRLPPWGVAQAPRARCCARAQALAGVSPWGPRTRRRYWMAAPCRRRIRR